MLILRWFFADLSNPVHAWNYSCGGWRAIVVLPNGLVDDLRAEQVR